jgi:HEAT repeats
MQLQEALETAEQGKWWSRLVFDPLNWLRQVRFSPALASAILILGFAGGVAMMYEIYGPNPSRTEVPIANNGPQASPLPSIAGIDSITPVPGTDQVTIKYNTVSTQQRQGSLNDQQIQQLLLYAARSNYNSGVRVDSVDLLAQRSSDMQVREALIYALQNDTNPGVRMKSLEALGNYVKTDTNVRDAVLRALVNDDNSGVRIEALRLIEPVKADGSVRGVLMALAAKDQSTYIKSQARTMLAQLPEID